MSWIIVAAALVWIMIPGLGFFYGGLLRRKNVLSMLWMSMVISAVAFFTWFFWGFSLAFSTSSGNPFIGDLKHFGFMDVDIQPSTGATTVPQLLFALYQGMFAAITPVIAVGAFADRARLMPVMIFTFCWCTVVYCPIAYGTWNVGNGWMNKLGGLDFAGGTPVHISVSVYRWTCRQQRACMTEPVRSLLCHSLALLPLQSPFSSDEGKATGQKRSAIDQRTYPMSSWALSCSGSAGTVSMEALPSVQTFEQSWQ